MITPPTQQIVCSIISRQLIADLSPTSRQPVADLLPTCHRPVANQLAINRPLVADRSPTGRRFLGIVVADQSPIDLQPKNAVFDRTVVALVAVVFQSQGSRRQVAVHVWPGLYWPFVWGIHRSPVNSPHKGQWRGVRINDWVNNREAGDLRRHRGHYDVNVMDTIISPEIWNHTIAFVTHVLAPCVARTSICDLWISTISGISVYENIKCRLFI